jgi:hypothetical protein
MEGSLILFTLVAAVTSVAVASLRQKKQEALLRSFGSVRALVIQRRPHPHVHGA